MVDMAGLRRALAHRLDIALIEDCAHAFEAERDGDRPGAHSDVAIFSFYATKNVTCGEGGAIVTRDAALYDKLVQTRRHGMTADAVDRYRDGRYRHWDMVRLGVKANLPDLLAVLLPDQIGSIRERLPVRRALAERYRQAFWTPRSAWSRTPGRGPCAPFVSDPRAAAGARQGDRRTQCSRIGVTVNYRAVPRMSYYRGRFGDLDRSVPVSTLWGEGTISLPLYPGLTRAEQDEVIAAVRERVVPLVLETPEARNPG
jgi:UDP-4-amino-4-deoxy-L-arabinose-oxoglutarate aminotransferase